MALRACRLCVLKWGRAMCEPATIMMGVGLAFSAFGAIQQGQAANDLAKYNAKIDENNAKTAEFAAQDAQARGQLEADQHRARVRQALGAQRVGIAASGGDLTDNTSLALLGDTAQFGELDAMTIENNAAREAWGLRVQRDNSIASAAGQRFQGAQAKQAGFTNAAGTILSGAGQIGAMRGGFGPSKTTTTLNPAGRAPNLGSMGGGQGLRLNFGR